MLPSNAQPDPFCFVGPVNQLTRGCFLSPVVGLGVGRGGTRDRNQDSHMFEVILSTPKVGIHVHALLFLTLCRPCGLWFSGLLYPWNSPGNNTGVGSHSLPTGVGSLPFQGPNLGLLHCRQILHCWSHKGSPLFPEVRSTLGLLGIPGSPASVDNPAISVASDFRGRSQGSKAIRTPGDSSGRVHFPGFNFCFTKETPHP